MFVIEFLFHAFRYVGRLFVKTIGKPLEILKKLNEMAGFDANEEIELYEVLFMMPVYYRLVMWSYTLTNETLLRL